MKRVIVTGITGHVGTVLSSRLAADGFEVHGLTRQSSPPGWESGSHERVWIHPIDGHTQTLVSLFEEIEPDVVVHLAALARREHLTTDVTPFITANIHFGTQLLEAAKVAGCRAIVTAGSYLQHSGEGQLHPFNLYAATKIAFEKILTFYVDAFGFSAIVLNLCNVYGELDLRPTLLCQMMDSYADGVPLSLHAGEAWVDLVHAEDVAAAFVQSIRVLAHHRSEGIGFSRYSVTSGRDMTSAELMSVFESLGLSRPEVTYERAGTPPRRVRPWRGICVPGWSPRISIQDGIARLLAHRTAGAKVTEDV
jgi:nucleoside-diphosphate-sugar epimerase